MNARLRTWLAAALCLVVAVALRSPNPGAASANTDSASFAATALGGLNGLAATYIWLYATREQEAGDPYQALWAAEAMTALQPKLGGLYDFQATLLAYDVANSAHQPVDRYRWIAAGLRLLDQGVQRNPRSASLRQAKAALLLDRIAAGTDPSVDLFRQAFAAQWDVLIGPPPVDWTRVDPAPLARAGLDVSVAASLDREFGPLDWRTAQAHALYWARTGEGLTDARRGRMLYAYELEALRSSCLDGEIVASGDGATWFTAPRPELAAAVERRFAKIAKVLPHDAGLRSGQAAWRRQAVLLLVAFGHVDEARAMLPADVTIDRAVKTARLELLEGDEAGAARLAADYRERARRSELAGKVDAAKGLRGMARIIAGE